MLVGVSGFGALAATGSFAGRARRSADPFSAPSLRRFFRPGHNLAARAIYLVPLTGGGLLALGHGEDLTAAWPWIGLALWCVAVALASAVVWPAERAIQGLLAGGEGGRAALGDAALRLERAVGACTVIFLLAVAVMVVQPR